MGYRPYRGPVSTLEQAMFADLPVSITCEKLRAQPADACLHSDADDFDKGAGYGLVVDGNNAAAIRS
jgi:hypothetical protein